MLAQGVTGYSLDKKRPIVVTGASGFVGSHVARSLAEAGHEVVGLLRNPYATGRIYHPNIRLCRIDLAEQELTIPDGALVIHTAALSSPWGAAAAYRRANVDVTARVIAACMQAKARLVHISSTSIFFAYRDRRDVADDAAWASPPCCEYARSKGEAELLVKDAVARGLDAVVVRARAVIGEGDNAILPRLLLAAKKGRLRRIGDGNNEVDLGYIDNLVHGILLAAQRGKRGRAYTITDDEPIKLWRLIDDLVEAANAPPVAKKISWKKLDFIAAQLERLHHLVPALGEPAITRYAAGLLAKSQTFDIIRAKEELGYQPLVDTKVGIERTRKWLCETDESPSKVSVDVEIIYTAHTHAPKKMLLRNQSWRGTDVPCFFALIRHPQYGLTLFDTGYSPHFVSATKRFPYSLYAKITKVDALTSAKDRLQERGIDPAAIDRIIISHFHADHIAGLQDFPNADYISSADAYSHFRRRRGFHGLTWGYLHQVLPPDFSKRHFSIGQLHGQGFGPFSATHDLFGDGSLRLVALPGHAAGQLGILLSTTTGRKLLAADACWLSQGYREQVLPHPLTNLLVHDRSAERQSLAHLHRMHVDFPNVEILPTHCPEVFDIHNAENE